MRALYVIAALAVAFLLGAFVEHVTGAPFGLVATAMVHTGTAPPLPADTASTAIPHHSNDQGLQDAPRNDIPQGAQTDFDRCVNTMILRREKESEARTVCQKIISGISG